MIFISIRMYPNSGKIYLKQSKSMDFLKIFYGPLRFIDPWLGTTALGGTNKVITRTQI